LWKSAQRESIVSASELVDLAVLEICMNLKVSDFAE
jgi:hypothetical protein